MIRKSGSWQGARVFDLAHPRRSSGALRVNLSLFLALLDLVSIAASFLILPMFKYVDEQWWAVPVVTLAIYGGTALNAGAYNLDALRDVASSQSAAMRSLLFTFTALFLVLYFFRIEQSLPRLFLLGTMALTVLLVVLARVLFDRLVDRFWRSSLVTELLLEVTPVVAELPRGVVRVSAQQAAIVPDLRDPAMMDRFAALMQGVDRVVISSPPEQRKSWAMMLKGANVLGEVLVDDANDVGAFGLGVLGPCHTLTVSSGPLSFQQSVVKRALDLALCVPILVALAPVLLVTALAIKLDSPGPVFFRQRRVGHSNAFFEILKFRSMRDEASDADGARSTQRRDDRITRVGRLIRRTSIDELPQLLNVLGGSMSLVGPRPHALGSLAGEHLFWDVDERYWHRHVLKPGITGLAQVRGLRGATEHRDDLSNRLQADLEYAANWSAWRDVMILITTFRVIVHKNSF